MRLKFDLLVIGFCVLVVAIFGVYGLLYAITTGNEVIAWWGLVGFVVVGVGAFVLAYFMQRRLSHIQQGLDQVLSERDGLQQRLDQVLSERDGLQQQLDQVLSEQGEVNKLSREDRIILYLSMCNVKVKPIAQLLEIGERSVVRTRSELKDKKLLQETEDV